MSLKTFLQSIADAIRSKSGETEQIPAGEFAQRIMDISTGTDVSSVTATASDVREGKVIVDAQGNQVQGTIASNPTISKNGNIVNVPAGIYDNEKSLGIDVYDFSADVISRANAHPLLDPNTQVIADYAFYRYTNLALTELPEKVSKLGAYSFWNCANMELVKLPSALTSIGESSLYRVFENTTLKNITIPSGVLSIGKNAFYSAAFETVEFLGTPNEIANSAFSYCDKLTTIVVPWSQGAVDGAPWGAENATIYYGYSGG